jgi:AAA15 family ATPase/GTPase
MQIRLSEVQLTNFKAFESIVITPDENFNIIIGENSAGKSTIFEGIHLWEKCYNAFVQASRKKFYQVTSAHRYVNYQELDFLRITDDDDLFFHSGRDRSAEITLTLKIEDVSYELGFKVSRPTSISNAFFRIQPIVKEQFTAFAEKVVAEGKTLDEAIFIYQTRPVSGVLQYESYFNEGQVKKKIQKGLSHEVLRNKIIAKRDSIGELESSISSILQKTVKFDLPPRTKAKTEEFISIKVSVNEGKKQDLHLQGSGFLQIVEILSTIEFLDAPLKLLLVDEPDSHIHSKLQSELITHLRRIVHNQFFIISHNDQFVTNAGDGEVFFLSESAKLAGILEPIQASSFDIIKRALGGVILSLEKLSQANHVVFVEGSDDEKYLSALYRKISTFEQVRNCITTVTFFPLRGKDKIADKIEYNKRTLTALFRDKTWNTIFDKDFSTDEVDQTLKGLIQRKGCNAFSHMGYCIESTLFSDIDILKRYISSLIDFVPDAETHRHIDTVIAEITADINNIHSDFHKELEARFLSQKSNRVEFANLTFGDVVRDWFEDGQLKLHMVMSKPVIKLFFQKINGLLNNRLDDLDELPDVASSSCFNGYINFIQSIDDLVPSIKDLFIQLEILEEVEVPVQVEGVMA